MTTRRLGVLAFGVVVAIALAVASALIVSGASLATALACGVAAGCIVWQRQRARVLRAGFARLGDALRDLELAIGIDDAAGASDASAAIAGDEARLRRLTQRSIDRWQALTAQVAELERRQVEALTTVRGRSSFMADLCHEIRTPLNGLLGFLSMLSESALDDQQREWVEVARGSGESLLTLLNDVLDWAKIEAGKLTLEQIELDRDELFENIVGLFAPAAQARGVELLLDLAPDLPPRWLGDPVRLRQVIANLVSNAVKFTAQGAIELAARAYELTGSNFVLEIDVTDSGVGISPERLARLFTPFEQAEESITRRFGGTGLGLSIVKRIVEQMAGEVSVESEIGRGARFRVRLPMVISSAPAPVAALPPLLVLLIDEHQRRCELLAKTLRSLGTETATAATATAAVGVIRGWAERPERLIVIAEEDVAPDAALLAAVTGRVGSRLIVLRPAAAAYDAVADGVDCVLVRPLRRSVLAATLAGESRGARARGTPPATWAGRRVLLVDDNIVNQRLMCTMLMRLGVEVLVAGDGLQAVAAFDRFPFDLILMDVQMPDMDGLEATRTIRSMQPAGAQVTIIALTASTDLADRQSCLAAGMNDYLAKPVRAAALREVMARYLPAAEMVAKE